VDHPPQYKIVIVGVGYVGSTQAACLIRQGHTVVAVDIDRQKLEAIISGGENDGTKCGIEPELQAAYQNHKLSVDSDFTAHLADADMVLICVDTPATAEGVHNVSQLLQVAERLGGGIEAMPERATPLLCVIRSTVAVGTTTNLIVPAIQRTAQQAPGEQYEVLYHPEFLREASAIADYFQPAKIVVGERTAGSAAKLMTIYDQIDAPKFAVSLELAELIKTVDNSFHALKAAFANEVGRIGLSCDLDVAKLFEMFVADTKLNISTAYLRPGGAFGGPCLTKDLQALQALARQKHVAGAILSSVIDSNEQHKEFIVNEIACRLPAPASILLVGLTFTAGTDDLRGSPLVELAVSLLDAQYALRIFDFDLPAGASIDSVAPELQAHLYYDLAAALSGAEVDLDLDLIIIGKSLKNRPDVAQMLKQSGVPTVDLNSFVWPDGVYCRSSAIKCSSIMRTSADKSTGAEIGVSTTKA
jgi:GDP-mannose 6-dehydrogenase